jgi:hypothetical protein
MDMRLANLGEVALLTARWQRAEKPAAVAEGPRPASWGRAQVLRARQLPHLVLCPDARLHRVRRFVADGASLPSSDRWPLLVTRIRQRSPYAV